MRLINVETLKLEEFLDEKIPKYAILSHTWGEDEVTFQDMQSSAGEHKLGYQKIRLTCQEAKSSRISYAWVDTCCIDKSSSAELSESINSMYRWYSNAEVCYVFLTDVSAPPSGELLPDWSPYSSKSAWFDEFSRSRWFTRGWTLQELIAPDCVLFYDRKWGYIGTKLDLCRLISAITKIDILALKGRISIGSSYCIAKRMSWASSRTTSRIEDRAYSLLGLFGVNMPLLYGEGAAAFTRLQEEIIKISTDHSIFAWGMQRAQNRRMRKVRFLEQTKKHSFLADSPSDFQHGYMISPCNYMPNQNESSYSITNMGLQISLPVLNPDFDNTNERNFLAILNCRLENDFKGPLALHIQSREISLKEVQHVNVVEGPNRPRLYPVGLHLATKTEPRSLCILSNFRKTRKAWQAFRALPVACNLRLEIAGAITAPLQVHDVFPPEDWNVDMNIAYLTSHPRGIQDSAAVFLCSENIKMALSFTDYSASCGLCVYLYTEQFPIRYEMETEAGVCVLESMDSSERMQAEYRHRVIPTWVPIPHAAEVWSSKVTLTFERERVVCEFVETEVLGNKAYLVQVRQSVLEEERRDLGRVEQWVQVE